MPLSQWNLSFLDHNANREYPLKDGASGNDQTGSFRLPDDFLVGLDLPIHAAMDVDPSGFYLRTVGVSPVGYSLTIAHHDNGAVFDVATAMIPRQGHSRNRSYALGGIEPFEDAVGKVTVGSLHSIEQQPPGLWEFGPADGAIEEDCIRPMIRGVQSIRVRRGSELSERLYGDIELVAGNNMEITPFLEPGQTPRIVFSAIQGEGTIDTCLCDGQEERPCIKTIGGVGGTPDGQFFFTGDDCVQIEPISNGLVFRDTCCTPCCGCPEIEVVTEALERLQQQQETTQVFVTSLQTVTSQFQLTVLGSRINDKGCNDCS